MPHLTPTTAGVKPVGEQGIAAQKRTCFTLYFRHVVRDSNDSFYLLFTCAAASI